MMSEMNQVRIKGAYRDFFKVLDGRNNLKFTVIVSYLSVKRNMHKLRKHKYNLSLHLRTFKVEYSVNIHI